MKRQISSDWIKAKQNYLLSKNRYILNKKDTEELKVSKVK